MSIKQSTRRPSSDTQWQYVGTRQKTRGRIKSGKLSVRPSLLKTCTGLNFSRDFPVPTDCRGAFEDAWCYASKSLKPTANKGLKKIQMLSNSLDVRHFFVESLCMYLKGQTAGRSET